MLSSAKFLTASPEMWTEPKDWPRTNEHHRIQPAGNKASTNQKDYPIGSPDQMENNNDIKAKESRTFFQRPANQNSYTFINTDELGHSITKGERENDTRDLDAPEIMEIKQAQST